jgi:hypothetical protein
MIGINDCIGKSIYPDDELLRNQVALSYLEPIYGGIPDFLYKVVLYGKEFFNAVEQIVWCSVNPQEGWGSFIFGTPVAGRIFFFQNEDDAILFKMVWG